MFPKHIHMPLTFLLNRAVLAEELTQQVWVGIAQEEEKHAAAVTRPRLQLYRLTSQ
jgi:hypothetical protein